MNVDVAFFVEIRVDTQFFRTRTHHGQRSLNGLLHDFTQRAGVGQLAFTRHTGGFNGQQIAAHFRPRQTRYLAYTVLAVSTTIVVTLNTKVFVQVVAVNNDVLQALIEQQLFDRLTTQLGDFTLQATHARFTGVIANDADDRAVFNGQFAFFQCVTFNLLRQQVTTGNVQFFVFGVARKTDHFHTIQQRCRDIHGVGGRHEHYIAEVVVHFQVVIAKRDVLLWIQHFKQG